jgi:hypothetical protein
MAALRKWILGILAVPGVVILCICMGIFFSADHFAYADMDRIISLGDPFKVAIFRKDIENVISYAFCREYKTLNDLEAQVCFSKQRQDGSYDGCPGGHSFTYNPQPDDKYVKYWIMGFMPIEVVYDSQGKVIFYYEAFGY